VPEPTQVRIGDVVVLTEFAERRLEQNHSMWNGDLRPCSLAEHSWPGTKFAALWIGMCLCIPTYALAGGMIAGGMSWWEAVLTILVGSVVVMGAILLVSHAGTKFGIPYPVFARLWFGTTGAHVPALARAVIAAGWFGINSWFGGQALDAILTRILPFWSSLAVTFPLPAPQPYPAPLHLAFSFLVFWAINVAIAMRGPQAIGRLAQSAAPLLGISAIGLLLWALASAHGFGPILAQPATLHGPAFWSAFFPSVIGVIAFWATLALNIPDYTRYAKSQRGQMLGQITSMPLTMALFSFIGIAVTSATVLVFGKALWNPVELIVKFPLPVVLLAGVIVILSSVTINVGANVMAPARAFENLRPQKITFAIGAVMTGVLSLATMPWYMLSTFATYIFTWLGTYGALLGPFDGIAIADYWLVRKRRLDLAQLYTPDGIYAYARGFNPRAVVALAIGWGVAALGLIVPSLHFLWSGGWLFGLIGGLAGYWLLMKNDTSAIDERTYEAITKVEASPREEPAPWVVPSPAVQ
jgi:NCS1 family nucleobase:cation symporter-1